MTKHVNPRTRGLLGVRAESKPSDTEIKKVLDELQKTFHDFRAANDERLKLVEKGQEDVVKTDEVDRINAAMDAGKAEIDKLLKQVGRLSVGGSADDRDVRAHAARIFSIATRKRVRPEDADVEAYGNYCRAFDELIRVEGNLDVLPMEVRAALTVGSDPGGGYLVPDEMSTEIEKRLFETSPMRQIARVVSISRGAWEAPYKSADATSGGWVGERQARPATATPTLGMQRIEAHEQYAYPEVTQTMLEDAALDVEGFITEETEDKMGRTENTAFVSGSGVMQPKGFIAYSADGDVATTDDASRAWGTLQYVVTGASAGFAGLSGIAGASDTDPLITLMAKLNPAYRPNARYAMNRATEATVRKLKDGDGRYLVGFGDLRDNAFGFSLLGTPIVNLEDMPAIGADSFSIAYGDFRRGYLIIDRVGFSVLRDPFTNKPYVGFYIRKRVGGDVRNFDAIKLLKFGTS